MEMKWTGDRVPETNPLRLQLKIDASFGRAETRTVDYMDADAQNPPDETEWWKAYLPSEEEIEAAAQGFDFSNPEKWLADKAAGTFKLDLDQPTEMTITEGMTIGGRKWEDRTKEVVSKKN
jgi:hypothetical protein